MFLYICNVTTANPCKPLSPISRIHGKYFHVKKLIITAKDMPKLIQKKTNPMMLDFSRKRKKISKIINVSASQLSALLKHLSATVHEVIYNCFILEVVGKCISLHI